MAVRSFQLGYLVPEFPTQTHVFFHREVESLRRRGLVVRWFSTSRPVERCPHAFAEAAERETIYLFPPSVIDAVELLASVGRLPRLIEYILRASRGETWKRRVRLMGISLCAAKLVRSARRSGLEHIHVHSCADAAHLVAMARKLGGPSYSLTLHGSLENYGKHHDLKMRGAVCITSAGNHLVEEIASKVGIDRGLLKSVPMGLDTNRFVPSADKFDVGRDSRTDLVRLVMVARLADGKGHPYAIEAVHTLKGEGLRLQLTIAGSGPQDGELKKLAGHLGVLGAEVIFAGSLPEEKVLALVQGADIALLPSFGSFEAYPVAVMEAMSCGVAVVVSRTGATPEMIESGTDGILIEKHDVAGLTAAIRRLVVDGAMRRALGMAARKRALRQFDVSKTSSALVEFIETHRARSERGE